MSVELRNVDTLAPPPGYSHVAVGRGGTVVFTAGAGVIALLRRRRKDRRP